MCNFLKKNLFNNYKNMKEEQGLQCQVRKPWA